MSAESSLDRRQEKTRQAITSVFMAMLFDQPYGAITVAAIAERANVGRSTFYEHFRTKSDVLSHCVAAPFSVLAGAVNAPEPAPALIFILQHFRENHSLGRVLLAMPTRTILMRVLAAEVEKCLPATAFPAPLLASQIAASADKIAQALCRTSHAMAQAMTASDD